jgi:hypothetical protein
MKRAAYEFVVQMWSAVVVVAILSSGVHAAAVFVANLTGDQEPPPGGPVVTDASGSGVVELSDDETSLSYVVDLQGLDLGGLLTEDTADDIVGMHIHNAPAGVNGSIVFGIIHPSQDADRIVTIAGNTIRVEGVWTAADPSNQTLASQLAALKSGSLYLNVHTVAHGGGEIRGQILVPEPSALLLVSAGVGLLCVARRRRSV